MKPETVRKQLGLLLLTTKSVMNRHVRVCFILFTSTHVVMYNIYGSYLLIQNNEDFTYHTSSGHPQRINSSSVINVRAKILKQTDQGLKVFTYNYKLTSYIQNLYCL